MIEIFNYREVNKGMVVATFSIKIKKWKDFCIYNLTLFQSERSTWVSFPGNKVEKDGETKFYSHCGFPDKELNDAFKAEILKSLQNHKK